jgi:hypothetical protein
LGIDPRELEMNRHVIGTRQMLDKLAGQVAASLGAGG